MTDWPEELDAMVAAPNHHRLLLENDKVRVIEARIEPRDSVPIHTHRWPSTHYILSWSDFIRRDDSGNVVLDTRQAGLNVEPGSALWSPALTPHTLENVGSQPLHIISVEVKD